MNDRINNVVEKIHDRDEFIYRLSKATGISLSTIISHWIKRSKFIIPEKYLETGYEVSVKTLQDQEERIKKHEDYIRNLKVTFEEIKP